MFHTALQTGDTTALADTIRIGVRGAVASGRAVFLKSLLIAVAIGSGGGCCALSAA